MGQLARAIISGGRLQGGSWHGFICKGLLCYGSLQGIVGRVQLVVGSGYWQLARSYWYDVVGREN